MVFGAPEVRGGTSWRPDLPIESQITENLTAILTAKTSNSDKAIDLALYVMKSQIFLDGNKRTAIIFANHFLIGKGLGLLYIPEDKTTEFKRLLVDYYETDHKSPLATFLKQYCLIQI